MQPQGGVYVPVPSGLPPGTQPYASAVGAPPETVDWMGGGMQPVGTSSRVYDAYTNLRVRQTTRGWLQEHLGYEDETTFEVIDAKASGETVVMLAQETSSFLLRLVLGRWHPWTIYVRGRTAAGGVRPTDAAAVRHDRPCRMPMSACKCCCFQEVQHMEARDDKSLGATVEQCYVCVPRFHVNNAAGEVEYVLSQPTCCDGLVVDVCAEGVCNCRVPFYVYDPTSSRLGKDNKIGRIVKVWSGLLKEAFTDADTFEVDFPPRATSAAKARLMGSLFLINQLGFEGGDQH